MYKLNVEQYWTTPNHPICVFWETEQNLVSYWSYRSTFPEFNLRTAQTTIPSPTVCRGVLVLGWFLVLMNSEHQSHWPMAFPTVFGEISQLPSSEIWSKSHRNPIPNHLPVILGQVKSPMAHPPVVSQIHGHTLHFEGSMPLGLKWKSPRARLTASQRGET